MGTTFCLQASVTIPSKAMHSYKVIYILRPLSSCLLTELQNRSKSKCATCIHFI